MFNDEHWSAGESFVGGLHHWVNTDTHSKALKAAGSCWVVHGATGCALLCVGSLVAQTVKRPSAMRETWVQSLGWEDPLEEGMATYSSILAWRIPWTEEPDSPWGCKQSDTTGWLSLHRHAKFVENTTVVEYSGFSFFFSVTALWWTVFLTHSCAHLLSFSYYKF